MNHQNLTLLLKILICHLRITFFQGTFRPFFTNDFKQYLIELGYLLQFVIKTDNQIGQSLHSTKNYLSNFQFKEYPEDATYSSLNLELFIKLSI